MENFKWLDRNGAIWYANAQLKQGHEMGNAIHAVLHQDIEPYCKNPKLASKDQLKRLVKDVRNFNLTGKYPSEFSSI
jgi:uncharacterized protein YdaT